MRYPPFDPNAHNSDLLPIAKVAWPATDGATALNIGSESSWHIHREIVSTPVAANQILESEPILEDAEEMRRFERSGWALTPHPLHARARMLIPWAVGFLIIGIFIHVLEPALLRLGLMSASLAGSVKIGLLDYPLLFVLAAPLVVAPIVMRVAANVIDVRRQRMFMRNPPSVPELNYSSPVADSPLKLSVKIPSSLTTKSVSARIRVGVLSPLRDPWMKAFGLEPNQRPPAGLSTPLAGSWTPRGADGSGVGEATPLLIGRGPARLFVDPMRLASSGPKCTVPIGETIAVEPPEGPWPASEYGPLVNIHWELVITIEQEKGLPLMWVENLQVAGSSNGHSVPVLTSQSGRIEA